VWNYFEELPTLFTQATGVKLYDMYDGQVAIVMCNRIAFLSPSTLKLNKVIIAETPGYLQYAYPMQPSKHIINYVRRISETEILIAFPRMISVLNEETNTFSMSAENVAFDVISARDVIFKVQTVHKCDEFKWLGNEYFIGRSEMENAILTFRLVGVEFPRTQKLHEYPLPKNASQYIPVDEHLVAILSNAGVTLLDVLTGETKNPLFGNFTGVDKVRNLLVVWNNQQVIVYDTMHQGIIYKYFAQNGFISSCVCTGDGYLCVVQEKNSIEFDIFVWNLFSEDWREVLVSCHAYEDITFLYN
jgi:hypothetical protein